MANYEAEAGNLNRAVDLYEQLLKKVMAGNPRVLNDLRDAPRTLSSVRGHDAEFTGGQG